MTAPSWYRRVTVVTEPPPVPIVAKPCPICAGIRVAAKDSRIIDALRISHSAGCRIGRAEDSTQAADYENPLGNFWRWSTPVEVELLTAYGFRHTDASLPVLAQLDPATSELTNLPAVRKYLAVTVVGFPTLGAGVRQRSFPNVFEPTI